MDGRVRAKAESAIRPSALPLPLTKGALIMARSALYFINYRLFLHEMTKPDIKPDYVARAVRLKAITRGVQSRVAKVRANKVFDRIMGKGEV